MAARSKDSSAPGQAGRSGRWTGRKRETYPVSESALERLDGGEAITVRPDGWLRGQLAQLEAIREDVDRALERNRESWRSRVPGTLRGLSPVDS